MGVIEGDAPVSDNDWEKVTKGGDAAITKWIAEQMLGKSCLVVLIGADTAGRKWIDHEIIKAWNDNKGVLGVYIHNLKNMEQKQSKKGENPFNNIMIGGSNGKKMSSVVNAYDPPYLDSTEVYAYIKKNLNKWVEDAITLR